MKYTIYIEFVNGDAMKRTASKKPYVTDNRLHIEDASSDEYAVFAMPEVRMYVVKTMKEAAQ
jgi:hypothetical protein